MTYSTNNLAARIKSFTKWALAAAIVPMLFVVSGASHLSAQKKDSVYMGKPRTTEGDTLTSKTGLKTIDIRIGKGKPAVKGSSVFVHYVAKLEDGTIFDSADDKARPFVFKLGKGKVIKGWDEGIVGMKVGGKRILIVPPELGYGGEAYGPIPANSTLVFEVDLVDVR